MKDWQPTSFSPQTGLLYIPHQNLCEDVEGMATSYIAGTPFVGASVDLQGRPGREPGVLTAWDPVAAKAVWEIKESFPVWSGTVVTAGGVVFYGTMDGWFKAVDARTGALRWQFKCGSGIIGQPIVYRGPRRPRVRGRSSRASGAGPAPWSATTSIPVTRLPATGSAR